MKWSPSEAAEIKKRGEQSADFFRILYKLQMLDRMRKYVRVNGRLERSQKWMLNNLFQDWGDMLTKRISKDCLNPEILAIRRNL